MASESSFRKIINVAELINCNALLRVDSAKRLIVYQTHPVLASIQLVLKKTFLKLSDLVLQFWFSDFILKRQLGLNRLVNMLTVFRYYGLLVWSLTEVQMALSLHWIVPLRSKFVATEARNEDINCYESLRSKEKKRDNSVPFSHQKKFQWFCFGWSIVWLRSTLPRWHCHWRVT